MASGIRFVFISCISILFSYSSLAQQCSCDTEFSFIRSYIEKNYPGFADKTPAYMGIDYKKITEEYQAKAHDEKNVTYCMMFMKEWLKYFKDNHLQIINAPLMGNDSEILATRIKNAEVIQISPDTLQKIKHSKSVEGIYSDSVYKIALISSPNSWRAYAAVVLESKNANWTPGMVKFELKEKNDSVLVDKKWLPVYPTILHMTNHGVYTNKAMAFNGYSLGGTWKKEGVKPPVANQKDQEKKNKKSWNFLELKKLDSKCMYLRISNFDSKLSDVIDSFLQDNDTTISKFPCLVLDLRGNSGGDNRSIEPLIPYIYTTPIVIEGDASYATKDNIDVEKAIAATTSQDDVKRWVTMEIAEMQGNYGHFTQVVNDTIRLDSIKRYPEKIVVLADNSSAGVTEQFLLAAKQSGKVVIMGQTTSGALDYSSRRQKKLPCMPYVLEYPIARSGRLPLHPVDNIGIKPDVTLNANADWVKEAVKYMEAVKK